MKEWHTRWGFRNPENDIRPSILGGLRALYTCMTKQPLEPSQFPESHSLRKEEALAGINMYDASITWLGHCAFLIKYDGTTILTDPFLEGTAGFGAFRTFRRLPCPITPEEIPLPDTILISHAHYDHLHTASIERIPSKERIQIVSPLGVAEKLGKKGFQSIVQLDWFQKTKTRCCEIKALPAIHYSEMPFNSTLWASFCLSFPRFKIYFSGDTGYGDIFKKHIRETGPYDLALIGIGGYHKNNKSSAAPLVHTSPEEALQVASDIDAKKMIGMHWGTINPTNEPPREPAERLEKAAEMDATTLRIGETIPL